jgi:hypothetical protein
MAKVKPVVFHAMKIAMSREIRMAAPVGYPSPRPCGPQPSELAPGGR